MHSVVVLNRNYEFHAEVTIKKVIKWLAKNKIEIVLEKEDETIKGIAMTIKLPLVVRLLDFIGWKIKHETIQYSDGAVFNRDGNNCQYWHTDEHGKRFVYQCTHQERTIDHVRPKDRGGETSFVNCVTSCREHNERIKKNRTPEEAGLVLIRKPVVPRFRKGDYAIFRFSYNPNKLSHQYYVEKFLKMA
jgi:hypothetical protein